MPRRWLHATLIAAGPLIGGGPARGEQYDVLELKTPGGFVAAYASAINAAGKVVGRAEMAGGMDRAVIWDETRHPTVVPATAGYSTVALDFTPQGGAVGWRYPGGRTTAPQGFHAPRQRPSRSSHRTRAAKRRLPGARVVADRLHTGRWASTD